MEDSTSCCKNERPRFKERNLGGNLSCRNTLEAKIRGAGSLQEIAAALKEISFVKEGN